jgi:hypothetical protein
MVVTFLEYCEWAAQYVRKWDCQIPFLRKPSRVGDCCVRTEHPGQPADSAHFRELGSCRSGAILRRRCPPERGWSCRIPRIDNRKAAAFEPADVTRDHTCVVGSRDRGNHEIDCRCRLPRPPAGGEDIGIGDGGFHVERQHPSFEILQEHGPCRCFEIEATAALRHDRKPGQDFCLADGGCEKEVDRLPSYPRRHLRHRLSAHHGG